MKTYTSYSKRFDYINEAVEAAEENETSQRQNKKGIQRRRYFRLTLTLTSSEAAATTHTQRYMDCAVLHTQKEVQIPKHAQRDKWCTLQ